jgi:dihydroorotase-like cyclic amidohydrolase
MRFAFVAPTVCVLPLLALSQSRIAEAPQLIQDVRVFDGEHVQEHRSVLIENGKISRIDDGLLKVGGAKIIDGQGRTLLPGLFDAHVHMPNNMEDAARQALELGVTTQLDMFTSEDGLKRIKKMGLKE